MHLLCNFSPKICKGKFSAISLQYGLDTDLSTILKVPFFKNNLIKQEMLLEKHYYTFEDLY